MQNGLEISVRYKKDALELENRKFITYESLQSDKVEQLLHYVVRDMFEHMKEAISG